MNCMNPRHSITDSLGSDSIGKAQSHYVVYAISCKTPNHYYVGYSNSFSYRMSQHINGTGAKFTQLHGVQLWDIIHEYADVESARVHESAHARRLKLMGLVVEGGSINPKSTVRSS
jgi:predicted GIY-YIG superfamily endonuclease